jgi:hypothetical protein
VLEQQWCRLHERHAGVLRLLAAYDARGGTRDLGPHLDPVVV